MTDSELLRQYVQGSQSAFTRLVQRHIDLVHSAALRQLRDPHLAEDVSQRVFLILSRKAAKLQGQTVLAAWLYNATRYACLDALKQRSRRQRHERKAAEMADRFIPGTDTETDRNSIWGQIEPVLDSAMAGLNSRDRQVLVMRFWESRSNEEVAGVLGLSSDAAKKRISRSIDRLRKLLLRKGVSVPAPLLFPLLAANSVRPAPAGLALKTVTAIAAGPATGAAGVLKGAVTIMAWTKAKVAAVAAAAILTVGGGTYLVKQAMAPKPLVVTLDSRPRPAQAAAMPIVSQAGPGTAWKARFDDVYRLEPGQTIRRVAPPYIPERKIFWQVTVPDLAPAMPETDKMWMTFNYDGAVHWQGATVGQPTLGTALESGVGLRPYEVESTIDPWAIPFPGDLITRSGATKEQKLAAMVPLIAQAAGRSFHFEKQHVTRNAIVVLGIYRPVPGKDAGGFKAIDVSVSLVPGTQYTTSTGFEQFCGALELMLRTRVIDQRSSKPPQLVSFRNNGVTPAVARDPQKLQSLLTNLSRQTSLEFSIEPRELDVWVMTE